MNTAGRDPKRQLEAATAVVRTLRESGYQALFAGGCVRDMLLGRVPKDYDIATNARPEDVEEVFPGAILTGKQFGVVRVRRSNSEFEIATFRKDSSYSDGRHPDAVTFTDAQTDAERRDFTINALFYDPVQDEVLDYVGGRADLSAGIIRAVGAARDRFNEDHLRMLRALRFASTLGFTLERSTSDAITATASSIKRIASERTRDEFTRMLLDAPQAGNAILQLDALGLLRPILPEVADMRGVDQPPQFHPEGDVLQHTVMMLNAMRTSDSRLAYAVLLHDVGKPPTMTIGPDRIRFHGHAHRGERITIDVLRRLRFSRDDINDIAFMVGNHMRFMEVMNMRRARLRRLIGAPTFDMELELHRLDCAASHLDMENYEFLVAARDEFLSEPVLPSPFLGGNDILAKGISPGPRVGELLNRAYELQLDGTIADRSVALLWLNEAVSTE